MHTLGIQENEGTENRTEDMFKQESPKLIPITRNSPRKLREHKQNKQNNPEVGILFQNTDKAHVLQRG